MGTQSALHTCRLLLDGTAMTISNGTYRVIDHQVPGALVYRCRALETQDTYEPVVKSPYVRKYKGHFIFVLISI